MNEAQEVEVPTEVETPHPSEAEVQRLSRLMQRYANELTQMTHRALQAEDALDTLQGR